MENKMKKQTSRINSIKEVGVRLKAVRDKLNFKQGAYAKKLGISQSFLSYIEKEPGSQIDEDQGIGKKF
jgi:DNA-binding XRE family transcriptional regulator